MISKNHKTTTVLVALAALSAILVAGSVSAASDHAAFAHKKGAKVKNSGIAIPTTTAQLQKCKTAGEGSFILDACTAMSTNTVTQMGGVMPGP